MTLLGLLALLVIATVAEGKMKSAVVVVRSEK